MKNIFALSVISKKLRWHRLWKSYGYWWPGDAKSPVASPGHQQPWYWPSSLDYSGPCVGKVFSCRLVSAKPLSEPMMKYCHWTLRNKFQWNFSRKANIFIQENEFENFVCKMASILSQPQWVLFVIARFAVVSFLIEALRNHDLKKKGFGSVRLVMEHLLHIIGLTTT